MNLLPHQIEGIDIITAAFVNNKEFLLGDEVGVMKTRQACVVAKSYPRALIIAPLSTFGGWLYEAQQAGLKLNQVGIHWPGGAVLINYERLEKYKELGEWKTIGKTSDGKLIQEFSSQGFDLVIWDEAHRLKSVKTKRFKIWKGIREKAGRILYLTATPGQEPLDVAYLQGIIGFKSFWPYVRSFKGTYEDRWGALRFRHGIPEDIARLNSIVSGNPLALRRTPDKIAGWPSLQKVVFPIKLTPAQCKDYETAMEDFVENRRSEGKRDLQKDVFDMVSVNQFRQRIGLLKVDAVVELAQELIGQGKVVTISCEYMATVRAIQDELKKDYQVGVLTGETPDSGRKAVLACSSRDELDAIIFSISEGINLQEAVKPRVQINAEPRWSGLAQHQVDGRTHRAGKSALVYQVVCSDTVDERVARILCARQSTLKAITGDALLSEALGLIVSSMQTV